MAKRRSLAEGSHPLYATRSFAFACRFSSKQVLDVKTLKVALEPSYQSVLALLCDVFMGIPQNSCRASAPWTYVGAERTTRTTPAMSCPRSAVVLEVMTFKVFWLCCCCCCKCDEYVVYRSSQGVHLNRATHLARPSPIKQLW